MSSTNLRKPLHHRGPLEKLAEKVDLAPQFVARNRLQRSAWPPRLLPRSNFPTCAAVARATRKASPSAATWLTRPAASAFAALMLRPVSSKIAHHGIAEIALQPRNAAEAGESAPAATPESKTAPSYPRRSSRKPAPAQIRRRR